MATKIIKVEQMIIGYIKFYTTTLLSYLGLSFIQDWDWLTKLVISGFITTLFFIAQYEYKKWRDRNK